MVLRTRECRRGGEGREGEGKGEKGRGGERRGRKKRKIMNEWMRYVQRCGVRLKLRAVSERVWGRVGTEPRGRRLLWAKGVNLQTQQTGVYTVRTCTCMDRYSHMHTRTSTHTHTGLLCSQAQISSFAAHRLTLSLRTPCSNLNFNATYVCL